MSSAPFRRLVKIYVVLLLVALLAGLPFSFDRNALTSVLAFEGLAWFVFAFLAGGFVETYRASLVRPSLVFTLPEKDRYVLPENSPAAMDDLRSKLAGQAGPRILAAASGLGFFGLAALGSYPPTLGLIALAVVIGALLVLPVSGKRHR